MSDPVLLFTIQLIAINSLLLLAIGYLKAEPRAASARIFALLAGFAVLYVIDGMSAPHIDPTFRIDLSRWDLLIHTAIAAIPGLFMIYSYLVFQERRHFPLILGILFAIQIVLEATLSLIGSSGAGLALDLLATVLDIMQLLFVGFAIYWTVKGWRSDLVEDRRALRMMIISLQGALIFFVVLVENFLMATGAINATEGDFVLVLAIAVLVTAMLIATMQFDYVSLGNVIRKVSVLKEENGTENSADFDIDTFNHQFRDARIYREAGLTIASLAKKLKIPEYRLRAFIHKTLGFRNFNAMLHQYRIEDACEALADPENRGVPVLTIALTVGYQSITPFNNAFREIMGVTPSEYRKRKLNGD
ncbi:MAG: helix-turn-helix domain-containing protein [Gammaproteobacteria bacterium]|nr:AraC family transcriptional regulator [Pseudomonadales bacterium]MCP5345725.1 AraC family transcriptional regulator [Pseudomonadales bacterium]